MHGDLWSAERMWSTSMHGTLPCRTLQHCMCRGLHSASNVYKTFADFCSSPQEGCYLAADLGLWCLCEMLFCFLIVTIIIIITACSELWKVLFLVPSVCGFLCMKYLGNR